MDLALTITGGVLFGYGALLLVVTLVISAKRTVDPLAAHSTDETVLADQAAEGPVAIRGTVVATEDGPLYDVLEGQAVAWWRVEVAGLSSVDRAGANRRIIHEESHRVDFLLDDGSRTPVRVDAASVTGYVSPHQGYGLGRKFTDAIALSDEQRVMIATRAGRSDGRHLTANRWAVAVGDTVTVTGWLHRTSTGPVVTGRADQQCIVTAFSHEEVVDERGKRARSRVGLTVAALAFVGVGGLLLWLAN